MIPQEDALEFMLFDLTACASPSSPATLTPSTAPGYDAATFTEDYTVACLSGTRAVWRRLEWESTVPNTASIVFSAQTADPLVDGGPPDFTTAQVVELANDTTGTTFPGSTVFIDTGAGADAGTLGRFNLAIAPDGGPPVVSKSFLRLTVTLNPTSDRSAAPTLIAWQVWADCVPSE
jgi:hypothetical protein